MAIDCATGSHLQALVPPRPQTPPLATAATNGSSVPPTGTAFIDFHPFSAKKDQSEFDLVAVRVVRRKRSFQGSRWVGALVTRGVRETQKILPVTVCVCVHARFWRLTKLGSVLRGSPLAQRGMAGGGG